MHPENNKEKQPFLPPSCLMLNLHLTCELTFFLYSKVSSIALAQWKLVKQQSYCFTPDVIGTD